MDVGCVWITLSLRDPTHLLLEYTWGNLQGKQVIIIFVSYMVRYSKPSRRSYDDDYRSSRHDAPRRSPSYSPR